MHESHTDGRETSETPQHLWSLHLLTVETWISLSRLLSFLSSFVSFWAKLWPSRCHSSTGTIFHVCTVKHLGMKTEWQTNKQTEDPNNKDILLLKTLLVLLKCTTSVISSCFSKCNQCNYITSHKTDNLVIFIHHQEVFWNLQSNYYEVSSKELCKIDFCFMDST